MRLVRSEMLEVLRTDYIKFARARGLPNRAINFGHALKNTLVPVITIIGLQLGAHHRLRDHHRDRVPVARHGPAVHPGGAARRHPGDGGLPDAGRRSCSSPSTSSSTCSTLRSIRASASSPGAPEPWRRTRRASNGARGLPRGAARTRPASTAICLAASCARSSTIVAALVTARDGAGGAARAADRAAQTRYDLRSSACIDANLPPAWRAGRRRRVPARHRRPGPRHPLDHPLRHARSSIGDRRAARCCSSR